eukprot:NODE_1099_length_2215_cov_0.462193.p2 type:complete len:205 gc:universal NODE_1099_length_2215_cov_0.462193:56-670(+)
MWSPIESDPEILFNYCKAINGADVPFSIHEVVGIESDCLSNLPCRIVAILAVLPINRNEMIPRKYFEETCFFLKQTVPNSCGTIALIHILANLFLANGPLQQFVERVYDKSPFEKALAFEKWSFIEEAHRKAAQKGSIMGDQMTNLHYVAMINLNGNLVELDGRLDGPIVHGKCENLLLDSINVFQCKYLPTNSIEMSLLTFCI